MLDSQANAPVERPIWTRVGEQPALGEAHRASLVEMAHRRGLTTATDAPLGQLAATSVAKVVPEALVQDELFELALAWKDVRLPVQLELQQAEAPPVVALLPQVDDTVEQPEADWAICVFGL